ncbi:MAG: DivIVA domain-containing protein [Desulfobacterales bacterium]|nr:DivIVA domain-containing protein [Desulfobacterales bacterium]
MKITPLDIQQKQFRIAFRGFDVREVDAFLERLAEEFARLTRKNGDLRKEIEKLKLDIRDFRDREKAFKQAMVNAQKTLDDMKNNAEKEAELIISEAHVKAEKILSSADTRLYQLHGDISELKRQRMQVELEIRTFLEAHTKLLDMNKEAMETEEEAEDKLKFIKST